MKSNMIIALIGMLLFPLVLHSQNIDSMILVLEQNISDRERIKTHNRLCFYYSTNDTTQLLYHRNKMDSIAQLTNDTLGKYLVNGIDIRYFTLRNEMNAVRNELRENLNYAQQLQNENFQAGTYYELSLLFRNEDKLDSALHYAERCHEISVNSDKVHPMNLSFILTYLGRLEQRRLQYKSALEYFFQAEEVCSTITEPHYSKNSFANTYKGISEIYSDMSDTSNSIKFLRKSLNLYQETNNHRSLSLGYKELGEYHLVHSIDSAQYYFTQAINSADKAGNQLTKGLIYIQLGDYWFLQNKSDQAKNYYLQANSIFENLDRNLSISDAQLKLAYIYESEMNNTLALEKVSQAIAYYVEYDHINNLIEAKNLQANLLAKTNRYAEALAETKEANRLKDSLTKIKTDQATKELLVKYETSNKELAIQEQALLLEKQEKKQVQYIAYIGFLILTLAGLGVFISIFRKQKATELKIRNQEILDLQQQNKILGLSSLIQGQEAERIRIAKDLHDGLGGLLSSVKAHYGKIKDELQIIQENIVFNRAQDLMDDAVDEVRRISHNLMPPMLRTNGLSAAVQSYMENISYAQNIKVTLDMRNMDQSIDENKSLFIYRIIQELTTNVIKHAEASEIQLQIIRLDDQLQIIFEDNGKGFVFDPESSSGVGLRSIQSRIDYLGGEIEF